MNPYLDSTLQSFGLKKVAPTVLDVKLFGGTTDGIGRTLDMAQMTGTAAPSWLSTNAGGLTSDGFSRHAVTYTIISRIIEAGAALPWYVYALDADGRRQVDTAHPLNALLMATNEAQSWHDILCALLGYLDTTGNAYLLKEAPANGPNAGKPGRVRVLPSPLIEVRGGSGWDDPVTGYREKQPDGQHVDHAPEDVCHIKYWNPSSTRYGLSPIAAGFKLVTAADAGLSARVRAYQNQGPPGILTKKGAGESWGQDGAQAAQSWFSSFLRGGRNQSRIPVVNGDVAWVSMGLSPVDLDVLEALQADRDGIADLFAYPGQLLNGSKGTTFSNVGEAKRSFYSGCVVIRLQKLRERLSPFLCAPYADGRTLNFDTSGVPELQANKQEQVAWLKDAWWLTSQRKQAIMGEAVDDTLPAYFIPSMLTAVLNPADAAAQAAAEAAALKRWEDAGIQDYK